MNPLRDYRSSTRAGGNATASDESAREIVDKIFGDRSQGHAVTDAEILASHPGLIDSLKVELGMADQIRQAMLAARRTTAGHEKLRSLTDSEFEALADGSRQPSDEESPFSEERKPRIPGYLLISEINRGGQAVVFRAIQETTGRTVAIKVMAGGPFADSRHRVRFEREAKILAALDHPNIVSIVERGRTPDGSFFFVMQYIEGLALDEYWTTQVPNDREGLRKLIELFAKIASAVELAHSRGVVHRDLKPSNVRVDQRGEPHVLDFGLARPVDDASDFSARTITMPGQIIGSLPWASPEQADGRSMELSASSDVYSMGVILFQAMTGSFPYSLDGPIDEVLLRIRTLKAGSPSRHPATRVGIDGSLDAIVLKSLAKLPQDRYYSAGGLAQDLEAWLAGRTLMAAPVRTRRRWIPQVAGLLIICLAGFTFAWRGNHLSEPMVVPLPTLQDGIGITLLRIPSGAFLMGSPDTEPGRNRDEHQRMVVVDHAFYIAKTEVTQSQYEKVMHGNPSDPRWLGPDLPVQNVSWNQAVAFCRRLSDMDHAHYRLPSEVEWEYACRAGSQQSFPDYSNPGLTTFSVENSGGALHPVAEKRPNAWGLFDMQGNVQEWCDDVYRSDSADLHTVVTHMTLRVIRGGSALQEAANCRAASRISGDENRHLPDLGFRVVRDP